MVANVSELEAVKNNLEVKVTQVENASEIVKLKQKEISLIEAKLNGTCCKIHKNSRNGKFFVR